MALILQRADRPQERHATMVGAGKVLERPFEHPCNIVLGSILTSI